MCRDPHQIKFVPLNKSVEYTAADLMTVYEVSSPMTIDVG